MRDGWARTQLGEVLVRDEERVPVEDGRTYPGIGVARDGQGLFHKEAFIGGATSYSHLTRVRAGQVVLRTITAWEAPIGVVSKEQEGGFVSPSVFPVFTVDANRLDPRFMALVCQSPRFWAEMRNRTTGSVLRRQTLSAEALLSISIDLPPLDEQQRIVDLISSLDATIAGTQVEASAAQTALRALRLYEIRWGDGERPLGELVDIPSGLVDPTDDRWADRPHIGVDRIEGGTGRLLPCSTAREDGVTSGKHFFTENDLIFAKIRPELVKAALPGFEGLCSADAYPLRPGPEVDPVYLLEALLSPVFTSRVTGMSSRTKMPKVNRQELMSVTIPVPPESVQRRVASLADALRSAQDAAAAAIRRALALRGALLADLLSGTHEIPASYDHLLDAA